MPNETFKFSNYLEPKEVRAVINAIADVSRHSDRDTLLVELLWQSGARVSEAIMLVPERIGMTSIILSNLKQSDPNATKEVEVSEFLCQQLKDFCNHNRVDVSEWVFFGSRSREKHLTRQYVHEIITKASEAAKVYRFGKKNPRTGGRFKGISPHVLRHSAAMHLLEETNDITLVKEHLGHSDTKTTKKYVQVKEGVKRLVSKIGKEVK